VTRLGLFSRRGSGLPAGPEQRVAAAQGGDAAAREELLRAYRDLALRVAGRLCGRHLRPDRDDEASLALIALNEAIDRYDAQSGASFATFAELVVRRRLVDHFRREASRRETPLSAFEVADEEGQVSNPVEVAAALAARRAEEEDEERRLDVARFREALQAYGIELGELVRAAPQHRDARERAVAAARAVAGNPVWAEYLRRHKALPLKELERDASLAVSRKTLERQRKYIIAVAVILMERIEHLMAYLPGG
jgi:RNA polymerase sigma factor